MRSYLISYDPLTFLLILMLQFESFQQEITYSKLTTETLEQGVKYAQS